MTAKEKAAVLRLAAMGYSDEEIASGMRMSLSQFHHYIETNLTFGIRWRHLKKKLEMQTRRKP